ncbi:RING-H2 finger protein ATL74-like [Corylus avellana]|uniref:RING-H2 finger protein ATL74-like n=1 Tax=Corylus avellana TaxID=13451 RepID=UPI00286C3682|nr:RING-H2 finger protein ATL74-like [Corylus avellana]
MIPASVSALCLSKSMKPTELHSRRLLLSGCPQKPHIENAERTISVCITIVIMITLICTLLISMFKCFRGRPSNNLSPPPQDTHTTASFPGDVLASLPILIYGGSFSPSSSSSKSSTTSSSPLGSETNCAICLGEFLHGEEVRVLPRCKHMYHKDCIDQWLVLRSLHCPICRDRTIELDVEPTRTRCAVVDVGDPSLLLGPSFANHLQ